jgi:hypothetical protein
MSSDGGNETDHKWYLSNHDQCYPDYTLVGSQHAAQAGENERVSPVGKEFSHTSRTPASVRVSQRPNQHSQDSERAVRRPRGRQ